MEEDVSGSIPWIEKYRPKHFDHIVLDPTNRAFFKQIIDGYFPNLLFYGPPGTGKTTTIINLIQEYQTKHSHPNKSNVIHLNASDERGIDIIRNQIYSFVKSLNLFETGLKFVILDEVDYMTKNAQQALKYLLQTTLNTNNVRFILICNYISKIDEALQNEFICVRFNQLPRKDIYEFIKMITKNENIDISDGNIDTILKIFHSDIRSMINYLQLNQNFLIEDWNNKTLNNDIFEEIRVLLKKINYTRIHEMIILLHNISIQYNVDKKQIVTDYFNYIIRSYPLEVTHDFLNVAKECLHDADVNLDDMLYYFASALSKINGVDKCT